MASQRHTQSHGRSHGGAQAHQRTVPRRGSGSPDEPAVPPESRASAGKPGLDPVLAAAKLVIMEHGPRRATLAEVARQAGVSRMTVYRRFESFDRLVSELLTAELAGLINRTAGAPEPRGSSRERAVAVVAHMTRGIAQHPLVVRVLQVDPESMVPLMVGRFGQTQRSSVQILEPLLSAGMTSRGGDGSIRDADPAVLAQGIVIAAQAYVFAAPAIADLPDPAAVWDEWEHMVTGMLLPASGVRR